MSAFDILSRHKLKRTACREGIINTLIDASIALSEDEIKSKLAAHFDRTTLYRSFKTLEEKRIIHKVVVDNLMIKYALGDALSKKAEHPHFYCKRCEMVQCLDSTDIEVPRLPHGYAFSEAELIIKGVCVNCKSTHYNE